MCGSDSISEKKAKLSLEKVWGHICQDIEIKVGGGNLRPNSEDLRQDRALGSDQNQVISAQGLPKMNYYLKIALLIFPLL